MKAIGLWGGFFCDVYCVFYTKESKLQVDCLSWKQNFRKEPTNQKAKIELCDWNILQRLLLLPTMWFSIDHK